MAAKKERPAQTPPKAPKTRTTQDPQPTRVHRRQRPRRHFA